MKAGLVAVFLLTVVGTLSVSLSGCGQKGPLYHEPSAKVSAEQAEQAERREQDDKR